MSEHASHLNIYIRGDKNNPSGVVNRLLTLGAKSYDGITLFDLKNSSNVFYIDFHDDKKIKFIDINSQLFVDAIENNKNWIEFTALNTIVDMPTTWDEACKNFYDAQQYEEGDNDTLNSVLDTLGKLIILRNIYRKGWIPSDGMPFYYIGCHNDELDCMKGNAWSQLLSFQDASTRDTFLKLFKDMIEEVKEYI